VIAGIYNGSISYWDNPQIATINPGITLPHDQIIPMHRADGSGETFLITSYLSNTSEWWNKNVSYGDVVLWPSNEASQAQSGDSGMLQGVEDQNYSIGYLSSSYLDNAMKTGNVGYAYLQNRAGNFINITALTMSSFVYPVTAYDYAVLNRLPNNSAYDYNDITFLSWVINTTEKENPSAIFNAYGYVALQQKVSQTSLGLVDEIGTCASTTTSSSRIVNGNTTSSSSTTVTSVSKTSYSSRTITSASQTTSISGYCS